MAESLSGYNQLEGDTSLQFNFFSTPSGKISQNGFVSFVATTASIKKILIEVDEFGGDDKLFCVNTIWWEEND